MITNYAVEARKYAEAIITEVTGFTTFERSSVHPDAHKNGIDQDASTRALYSPTEIKAYCYWLTGGAPVAAVEVGDYQHQFRVPLTGDRDGDTLRLRQAIDMHQHCENTPITLPGAGADNE